jgi:murein L,D-transpeptidase YcbB/YkuD
MEVRTYLESRHPQNEEYLILRRELEVLRASAEDDVVIDPRTVIKPGQTSEELPKILHLIERKADDAFRAEHGAALNADLRATVYTDGLVAVVKAAQKAHGLSADGIIGPRTIARLAGESKAASIEKVLLALERLRWLPSDLGDPHVFINQASFMATFTEGGQDRLSMRIVVGTRANQTSFFHDEIEQVDFNPYWGVPQSILVNEMLPRLRSDPGYLDRSGYEITTVKGQRISSSSVDWNQIGGTVPFDVRQPPGSDNALGELKILFPNSHAIYMHDTPAKNLFQRDMRAYSHGCVRLADPRGMAAAVLGWSREEIAERLRKGHSSEKVVRKVPVYVAYFTAWRDSEGKVGFYDDVYGRDEHLRKAMDLTTSSRQSGS